MDETRLDPLARLDSTAEAVGGLRKILAAEEPLEVVLARVAAMAAGAIPDADAVTITSLTEGRPHTVAFTDERAALLDHTQYAPEGGPCLEAAQRQQPVRTQIVDQSQQWPVFHEAAQLAGVHACLSVPLVIGDPTEHELVGSLNVYSYTPTAFDPFDEKLMELFTGAAGAAITNARRWEQSRQTVTQLEQALTSRAEIDQAKGVLMALHGCSAEEAFELLAAQSKQQNVKLREVARQLMASVRAAGQR